MCVEEGVADDEDVAEGAVEGLTERINDDEGGAGGAVEEKTRQQPQTPMTC